MTEVPNLFRIILQVSDLDQATDFYATLLGINGRRVSGERHYFDCGSVILALVNPTSGGDQARPTPDYLYFSVKDIEKVYERARELGCLSKDTVHGDSAGEILTRPWGERSFYVEDPFGNGLCFVAAKTLYTGH